MTLLSLSKRKHIEGVQWGAHHTNTTNLLGEMACAYKLFFTIHHKMPPAAKTKKGVLLHPF